MNKTIQKALLRSLLIIAPVLFMQSCGIIGGKKKDGGGSSKGGGLLGKKGKSKPTNGDRDIDGIVNGEDVATSRRGFKQTTPFGMVLIPSGSYTMGQADEDVMATQISFNKKITISPFYMDDTEITNHEYRQFVNTMLADSVSTLGEEFIMTKLYPDTTVWTKDFSYHNGDQLTEDYYSSPAFDTYPVVGVSWDAAQYFCKWRTQLYNNFRASKNQARSPSFRLPSEAEWEWAARGGKEGAKYPWGNPYVSNGKGCMLANFKPARGNYRADGYAYTAPATSFNANDYGLYNMAGNVAEWCQDAYAESYMPVTWDLNPVYNDPNEPRKIVKGGSWKDVAYYLETGTRAYEFKDATRSYIGFRCAMNRLGAVPGRE